MEPEPQGEEEDDGDPFLDSSVEIGAEEADDQEREDDDDDPFASPDDSADEGERLPCCRVFASCLVGGTLQHG